jgi:HK97 family phage major capsid protein
MNKKMRELMNSIQAKTAEAQKYMNGSDGVEKDVEKASQIMDEVDALRKEYETEKRIFESGKDQGIEGADPHTPEENKTLTGEQIIAKEVRAIMAPAKFASDKALQESVDEDGGYTVPEDIQTAVNHWKEIQYSFLDDISVEPVSTNKGARTYQKKADTEAFVDLDENGAITKEIAAPQFERITYAIQDRAGFMPVSNDLTADSDANISAIVTDWLGRANVATANAKILAIIAEHTNPGESSKGQIAIDGVDGIKKVVNVTLGQAYKSGAKIITNDDGLNYLDTLKDANGRPMLNPDPTDSAKLSLRCGTVVIPVKVIPNKAFKSNGTKIPVIIGDLKAGIRKYDRQSMSLKASDVAVIGNFNAFAMNMTLIRAILRDDYKELDADAYVYGYIDTATEGE